MAPPPWIVGFTTNPSLLKKAGVRDYEAYARELVAAVPDRHISFEVFSDDIAEMVAQAGVIARWGEHVHVKLPVTTTRGEPLIEAVRALTREGVKVNMTAIFTTDQVRRGGRRRRVPPHPPGARRRAQEAAGARQPDGGRALARRGSGVPRRRPSG